jgi:hypothetical protein
MHAQILTGRIFEAASSWIHDTVVDPEVLVGSAGGGR